MATITTTINREDMIKLTRRAQRIGMSPKQAFSIIARKGVEFFLSKFVGATIGANS